MTIDTTIPLWGLITVMISLLTFVYAFVATRRKDIDERFKQGSRRMDDLARRVDALDGTVKGMPGTRDLHEVQLALATLNGSLGKVEAVIQGNAQIMTRLEAIVTRHEQHLLESR